MAVYLDYAAAEPVRDEVLNDLRTNAEFYYNPSSVNMLSRMNLTGIEGVRSLIAEKINCDPDEVYFTSGASEANAWAVDGFLKSYENSTVISTNIEHSSILNNPNVKPLIQCDSKGFIHPDAIEATKDSWTENTLIVIGHANNEVGSIQDIEKLSKECEGQYLMVDAAQTFNKLDIDVKKMNIDMLSASAGKIGGIRGIGFLYISKRMNIEPIIYGTQENGLRGGTYFDLGIKAFGQALEHKYDSLGVSLKRNFLLKELNKIIEIELLGTVENRLPNNVLINVRNTTLDSQQIVSLLEEHGFVVSSGSACHAGNPKLSHVLEAMGYTPETAKTVIRITIGEDTDVNDLYDFARVLDSIIDMFHAWKY